MEYFLISVLNGAIYGLLLFMVAAGLTLVFGMMGVLNFAHASFYMLGAYFAYTLQPLTGFWCAVVLSPLMVGLVGVLVERFFLRHVHRYGHANELLLTFGLSFIIAEIIKLMYGNFAVEYQIPASLNLSAFRLAGSNYPIYRLIMGSIALFMFAAMYIILKYTRVGIVVRSAIYKPSMAGALGHNVPLVFMAMFGFGAALAGLAGAVAGAFYTTSPTMAFDLGALVFVVVVVGGLGSLAGAMFASLLIGVVTSLAVGIDVSLADLLELINLGAWARELGGLMTLKVSNLAATIPFALMLLVLLVRPSGLLGEKE